MKYNCERCKYSSNVKQNYNKHINSDRHKQKMETNISCFEIKCIKCDKILLSKTSAWRHAKTCNVNVSEPIPIPLDNMPVIIENQEIKDLLKKLIDRQELLLNGQELLINENIALKQLIIELPKFNPRLVTRNISQNISRSIGFS